VWARIPCLLAHTPLDVPFRTVLVATDFSPPARHALELVADWLRGPLNLAGPGTASVRALIVCIAAYADPVQPPVDIKALLDREVAHFRARLGPSDHVVAEPVIRSAPMVAEGVEEVAGERDADLVVAGTHGYHMISRMLLGSVAAAIAATLRRPLLLVPPPGTDRG
jgi:nucleotide-binding universal stress UspA family protein